MAATLARADATRVLIVGCGEEAHHHVLALRALNRFTHFSVWGRSAERAQAFADTHDCTAVADLPTAVAQADVIITVTSSTTPILQGAWIKPGQHINLVGAAVASSAEADEVLVQRSRYVVDYRDAALAAAGELLNAIKAGVVTQDHIAAEIGEVLCGDKPARQTEHDITTYKSLGVTAQDLAAAHAVHQAALAQGVGQDINLME
jgi:ornithine cyclodeaminase/alanine dehydrogenase-like protein (mu-crystallin family)